MQKLTSRVSYLPPIIALSLLVAARPTLGATHHWGIYIQGHAPALVPHNIQFGFNEQRWRRWPEACMPDYLDEESAAPTPKGKEPEQLPSPEKPPEPAADDDVAPPPPGEAAEGMPEAAPEQPPSDMELQPLPAPGEAGPEPPPGLTEPEPAEPQPALPPAAEPQPTEPQPQPAEPPSAEPAPSEGSPQQPPGTLPATPGEPTPAGPQPPDASPAPTPATPLPVPPTKLESRRGQPNRPGLEHRRAASSTHGRPSRGNAAGEDAREAVFHEDFPRDHRSKPSASSVLRTREVNRPQPESDRQSAPVNRSAPGQPELFQPGPSARSPRAPSTAAKRVSYDARINDSTGRSSVANVVPAVEADATGQGTAATDWTPRQQVAPQRANPLRVSVNTTAADASEASGSRVNPLRYGNE